jgi:hypothetical protein
MLLIAADCLYLLLLQLQCLPCCMVAAPTSQFDDDFVSKHYSQFESAADLRQNLISSTSLARMKDLEEQVQDAIVTQVF